MKKICEDAQVLMNPNFVSHEEGKVHLATQQAIDSVKEQVEELKKDHKELIDLCQQKIDLFLVSMKFHLIIRQVSCVCCLPAKERSLHCFCKFPRQLDRLVVYAALCTATTYVSTTTLHMLL